MEQKLTKGQKLTMWMKWIISTLIGFAGVGLIYYQVFLIEKEISGSITYSDDKPISNAKVIINHKSKNIASLIEYSNTDGHFKFFKPKRGKYSISIEHEDYFPYTGDIESGITGKQFKLERFVFDLSIVILDNQFKTPIDNVIVEISNGLNPNRTTQSDQNGLALFNGLYRGSYIIDLKKDNYHPTKYNLQKKDILNTDTSIEIKMQRIGPDNGNGPDIIPVPLSNWIRWGNVSVNRYEQGIQISGDISNGTAGINTVSVPREYANRIIVFTISNTRNSRYDQGELFKFEVNDIAQRPNEFNRINMNDNDYVNAEDGQVSFTLPSDPTKMQLVFYNCNLNGLVISAQIR